MEGECSGVLANSVGVGSVKEDGGLHRGQETPRNADAKHTNRTLTGVEMGGFIRLHIIPFFKRTVVVV